MHPVIVAAACIEADPVRRERLRAQLPEGPDWEQLLARADAHGVAPLLFHNLEQAGADVPQQFRRRLHGIYMSHRHANRERLQTLRALLDEFTDNGIRAAVLKGGALSVLLYPDPALRPMSDLDILVPRNQAQRAQSLLPGLSFNVPATHHSRYMKGHHHLPGATRDQSGMVMAVEVHVDALSHDCRDHMTMQDLDEPLREFELDGRPAWTLGHIDMLRQLVGHALGPAERLRLIWVVDILEYAGRHAHEIDWHRIRSRYPDLLNALALFGQVLPLPPTLNGILPPAPDPVPDGTGRVILPLTRILVRGKSLRQRFAELYFPSDWWLRGFYGIPAGRGLAWCRWVTHSLQLARWLLRRLAGAAA